MPSIYEELRETAKLSQWQQPAPPDAGEQEHLGWLAQAIASITETQFTAMPVQAQEWFDAAAEALNSKKPVPVPDGYGKPKLTLITRPRAATPPPPAQPLTGFAEGLDQFTLSDQPSPAVEEPPQPLPLQDEYEPEPEDEPETPVQHSPEPVNVGTVEAPPAPKTRKRRVSRGVTMKAPPPPPQEEEEPPESKVAKTAARIKAARTKGNGAVHAKQRRQSPPKPASITQMIREMVIRDERISDAEIIARLLDDDIDMTVKNDKGKDRIATVSTLRYDTLRTLSLAKAGGWTPPR